MKDIWTIDKKLKEKGYTESSNCFSYHPDKFEYVKQFNGGQIELLFVCTPNKNVQHFDLCLSNRQDIKVHLVKNTVDELDNLLRKEKMLEEALKEVIETLRKAESSEA